MNNVDYQITPSDEHRVVVRIRRKRWSEILQRNFMLTELIVTVPIGLQNEIAADLEAYCRASEAVQADFLGKLRSSHYTGRISLDGNPTTNHGVYDEHRMDDDGGQETPVVAQSELF